MFIRLIKTVNKAFFEKNIKPIMYKICIKSYRSIKQTLSLQQNFKNTFLRYE